jgi:hypothetical protein
MRKITLCFILLGVIILACGTTPAVTPTMDVNSIVAQTIAVYTVEALLTRAAIPTQTETQTEPATQTETPPLPTETIPPTAIPPTETFTPTPLPPTATFTATPEETAPNPLPVGYTGVILNKGDCFNFEDGGVSVPDQRCDIWLTKQFLFSQMNGAHLSGYVTMDAPTRTHCVTGRYEPGDLAIQTDLYMCFITDEGRAGFIVVREYRGNVPFTGIVFDYWVFR